MPLQMESTSPDTGYSFTRETGARSQSIFSFPPDPSLRLKAPLRDIKCIFHIPPSAS